MIDTIFGLAILSVIGLIFFVASLAKAGERARARRRELEEVVKSNEDRKNIRNMPDSELDDKLREHWK